MKFGVSVTSRPDLLVNRRRKLKQLTTAVAKAVDSAAKLAASDMAATMKAAGLGKLANVVRSTSDVRKGRVPDPGDGTGKWRAGATVFARHGSDRTTGALQAYSQGQTTIIPRRGRWLAFSTDEIPKRVGRRRMTPELYIAGGFEKKIGKLHFIASKTHAGEAFLIARNVSVDAARGYGKAKRVPRTGNIRPGRKGVDFIVAFILIRVTRRSQRFDPAAIMDKRVRAIGDEARRLLRGTRSGAVGGPVIASSGGSLEQL